MDRGIMEAVLAKADANHKLACADAWALAEELQVSLGAVGQAAEACGVKITRCQLGCF